MPRRKKRCHYCVTAEGNTRDHIIAKARGGPGAQWNIVPACIPCNSAKGDDLPTCTCQKCQIALKWWRDLTWTPAGLDVYGVADLWGGNPPVTGRCAP